MPCSPASSSPVREFASSKTIGDVVGAAVGLFVGITVGAGVGGTMHSLSNGSQRTCLRDTRTYTPLQELDRYISSLPHPSTFVIETSVLNRS